MPKQAAFSFRSLLVVILITAGISAAALWAAGLTPSDGRLAVVTLTVILLAAICGEFVRRRFRLSLRGLLVLITVFGIVLGLYADRSIQVLKRRQAADRLLMLGGKVKYEESWSWFKTKAGLVLPGWLRQSSPRALFGRVAEVTLPADLNDEQFASVADVLPEITYLSLNHTRVTDGELWRLLRSTELRMLFLDSQQLTDTSVDSLRRLPQLQELGLWGTHVETDRLELLSELPNLTKFSICYSTVEDGSFRHLAKLNRVREIRVAQCEISEDELEHLAAMASLRHLDLWSSKITDDAIVHLEGLDQVKSLNLAETEITPEGIARLKEALPNCNVFDGNWD